MKYSFIAISIIIAVSFAQDPENILVGHDIIFGLGGDVLTAIGNLWPGAYLESYDGDYDGFNTAINGGTDWDIIVCEAHNCDPCVVFASLEAYYNSGGLLFYASWVMDISTSLNAAMGVSGATSISGPGSGLYLDTYLWDTGHDIGVGITDWCCTDPGYGVLGHALTVSEAVPVTGWVPAETAGEAAICVTNDGASIISGYFPSLNPTQGVELWENILTFMWESVGLVPSTWGSIKTQF